MAQLPLDQAITRFQKNDERLDKFANGSVTESYISSGGASVPSIQKFLAAKDVAINVGAESILAQTTTQAGLAQTSATASQNSAIAAAASATNAADAVNVFKSEVAAPAGSGLVGFTQSGTGAVARTVQDELRDTVSVKQFGAVGDGVTDDTTAIQAAINAYLATDLCLYFPKGVYKVSGTLSITNAKSVKFHGDGLGASVLRWSTSGGIDIDFPTPEGTVTEDQVAVFRDLSFLTQAAGGGVALDVSWATAVGDTSVGLIVDGCLIASQDKNDNQYWTHGIKTTNGRRVYISNSAIDGKSVTTDMAGAIWLTGGTVESHIHACDITHCAVAVEIDDECEGVFITSTNMVYVNTGVAWSAAVGYSGTDLVVDGGHISALSASIIANRLAHGFISNNLIQKREGTGNNYTDIKLVTACKFWKIYGNHFQLSGTGGTEDGIDILDDGGNQFIDIHNNTFENRDKAIWLQGACNNIAVRDNVGVVSSVNTMIQNDSTGSNIVLRDNSPVSNSFTFLTGATPSVNGSETKYFLLNNGTSTTVTNFTGGQDGVHYSFVANNSNTTIQHNVNINLQGGTNFAMVDGAVLTLIYQASGSMWREISRRT